MPYPVIFLILLLAAAVCLFPRQFRKRQPPRQIFLSVHNQSESIEGRIRLLLFRYPQSEIYVTDRNSTDETPEILARLAADCTRIHIA